MVACPGTARACVTRRGMWTVERPRRRRSAHLSCIRCSFGRSRRVGGPARPGGAPARCAGRAFWGRARRLAFHHRLLDLLEVLDDPLAGAGHVPPSGLEPRADVLEQVARVAADLALQILKRGFSGLDRGPQTVERCAAGLLRTAVCGMSPPSRIVPARWSAQAYANDRAAGVQAVSRTAPPLRRARPVTVRLCCRETLGPTRTGGRRVRSSSSPVAVRRRAAAVCLRLCLERGSTC
jgi:hypothetical protein